VLLHISARCGADELLKADKQRRKALGAGKAKAAAAKAATPKRGVKAQKDLGILAKSTPKKGAIAAKTGVTPKRKPTGAGMAVKQMPKKKHVSANGNGMATPKANIPQKQQTNKTPKVGALAPMSVSGSAFNILPPFYTQLSLSYVHPQANSRSTFPPLRQTVSSTDTALADHPTSIALR